MAATVVGAAVEGTDCVVYTTVTGADVAEPIYKNVLC